MEGVMMTKLRAAIATAVIALGLAAGGSFAASTPAHADNDGTWRREAQWHDWQRERAWRENQWRERDWARERAWREHQWREREWRERQGYYQQPRYYYPAPRSYWR
jgi:hypothetical protein